MTTKQAINGILLLDKEPGDSSNLVLQKVKRLVGAQKAGHTGTLDPGASGMLPICFGESTKLIRFLLAANKAYEVKLCLGQTTTTGDFQGEALKTRHVPYLQAAELEHILQDFRGLIEQIPPIYSALKQKGKRWYELAREGKAEEIERKARTIHISKLTLNQYEYIDDKTAYIYLTVYCSKGTYIRSLAEDIGEKIGCGAHVLALKRLFVDPFEGHRMFKLSDLTDMDCSNPSFLLNSERAIPHIPKIQVSKEGYECLYQGKHYKDESQNEDESGTGNRILGWVQLWCEPLNYFFGIGERLESGWIAPIRLFKRV